MNTALIEASCYLDARRRGFFSVLCDGRQQSYRLSQLPDVLPCLPTNTNVYLSQQTFYRPPRRVVNLERLGVAFVDLETHKSQHADRTPEQQVQALLLYCDDNDIPRPSLVNFSGRGLHVKWPFSTPVPAAVLPRWNALQKALNDALKPFCPDRAARDAARTLRMVGSTNPRAKQECRTIHNDGGKWDFEEITHQLLPLARQELQARRKANAEAAKRYVAHANLWTPKTLWWNRLADVRRLIALRGWTDGVPEGSRNNFLLVAACAVCYAADVADLEGEVGELVQEFCPSLPLHEAMNNTGTVLRLAKAGKPYRFHSERLIELLDIQPDEQRLMKTLIDADARKRRRQDHDCLAKRKHSDRQTYEQQAQARREQAHRFRAEGLSYRSIAEHMGVTINAVDKLLRGRSLSKGGDAPHPDQ